jgi:hypothetical protein
LGWKFKKKVDSWIGNVKPLVLTEILAGSDVTGFGSSGTTEFATPLNLNFCLILRFFRALIQGDLQVY